MEELEFIKDVVYIDWRTKVSYVPPIRSQDRTSACTAFANTSVVEYWKGKGYSVQHLLDLAPEQKPKPGVPPAYLQFNIHEIVKYVTEHGLCLESNHRPLDWERHPRKCNRRCHKIAFKRGDGYNEDKMIAALVNQGPFIASIHSTQEFRDWRGDTNDGIFVQKKVEESVNPADKIPKHAIVVMGYGHIWKRNVRTGEDVCTNYFIIHNSWGRNWGEGGYARVRMSGDDPAAEFYPIKSLYIPYSMNKCGMRYIPMGGEIPAQESEDEDLSSSVYRGSWDRGGIPRISTLFQNDQHALAYDESTEANPYGCLSPGGIHTWSSLLEMGRGDRKLIDPRFCAAIACDIYENLPMAEEQHTMDPRFCTAIACDIYEKLPMAEVPLSTITFEKGPSTAIHYIDRHLSGNAIKMPQLQLVLQMESAILDYLKFEIHLARHRMLNQYRRIFSKTS